MGEGPVKASVRNQGQVACTRSTKYSKAKRWWVGGWSVSRRQGWFAVQYSDVEACFAGEWCSALVVSCALMHHDSGAVVAVLLVLWWVWPSPRQWLWKEKREPKPRLFLCEFGMY